MKSLFLSKQAFHFYHDPKFTRRKAKLKICAILTVLISRFFTKYFYQFSDIFTVWIIRFGFQKKL